MRKKLERFTSFNINHWHYNDCQHLIASNGNDEEVRKKNTEKNNNNKIIVIEKISYVSAKYMCVVYIELMPTLLFKDEDKKNRNVCRWKKPICSKHLIHSWITEIAYACIKYPMIMAPNFFFWWENRLRSIRRKQNITLLYVCI